MGMTIVSTFFALPQDRVLMIPHGRGAVPAGREVFVEPVAPSALDLSAVCLEHVQYLEASSTATEMASRSNCSPDRARPASRGTSGSF